MSKAAEGFSNFASRFRLEENYLVQWIRQHFYQEIMRCAPPSATLLDLGAGTGIDAIYLVHKGYRVHGIDLASAMIQHLQELVSDKFTAQHLSMTNLEDSKVQPIDLVYSNFGAINCVSDLSSIFRGIQQVLRPNGKVVVMTLPPFSPWAIIQALFSPKMLRRLGGYHSSQATAQTAGVLYPTFYYSPHTIAKAAGSHFRLLRVQSICLIAPPPSLAWLNRFFPIQWLMKWEARLKPHLPIGDLCLTTLQYQS
jgi:ubiquinone/menaquinone biosynthesis C-methylase UbiE